MPISKEDHKSSWEQYHIILLSHIVLYWIWSLLDSDESLLVTGVSPPIFGLQHCCRFRKQMQLNMGGLRLNTLFLYVLFHHFHLFFLFFFFNFPSTVYIASFSILSFPIFSFSLCGSLLACLGVINFNFVSCPSCIKKRERLSRLSVFKWSHAHLKRRWEEFVWAISHNTSFTHCPILNLILVWVGLKLVGNWSFSTKFLAYNIVVAFVNEYNWTWVAFD